MKAILSTTYFGPVQWYQKLNRYEEVHIEHNDSYQKQTFRNRCLIATTNGVQALTVPVATAGRERDYPHKRSRQLAPPALERAELCLWRLSFLSIL